MSARVTGSTLALLRIDTIKAQVYGIPLIRPCEPPDETCCTSVGTESPDRAGWPRRPPCKAPLTDRRRIVGRYGEEEQRRAAGCIGRPATGGDSFTTSEEKAGETGRPPS